ncbi:MAG: hypothetical protein ABIG93_00735 [archaeon]
MFGIKKKGKTSRSTKRTTKSKSSSSASHVCKSCGGGSSKGKKGNSKDPLCLSDQKSIECYYSTEKRKILEGVRRLETEKTKEMLALTKKELIQVLQKKKKLEELYKDVEKYLDRMNKRADELKLQKEKESDIAKKTRFFVSSMKGLKRELKSIENARKELISKERNIVYQIERMFSKKDACLFLTNKSDSKKIKEMEDTMEYILEEARYLISQEVDVTATPLNLITGINKRRMEEIKRLNVKLTDINNAKREVLEREHMLHIDSSRASSELRKIQQREESLEKKMLQLLDAESKTRVKKKKR